jgi:hypothetical protein
MLIFGVKLNAKSAILGVHVAVRVCTVVGREKLGVVILLRRKSPLASL